jgi:hypothetical protein
MSMAHYLKMPKKSQVLALLELGWSYRQIEAETGVRRETVSRYDRVRRGNAAKTFPGSVPPESPLSADVPETDAAKADTAFPGSPPNVALIRSRGQVNSVGAAGLTLLAAMLNRECPTWRPRQPSQRA